jgi:hypothetical protein
MRTYQKDIEAENARLRELLTIALEVLQFDVQPIGDKGYDARGEIIERLRAILPE